MLQRLLDAFPDGLRNGVRVDGEPADEVGVLPRLVGVGQGVVQLAALPLVGVRFDALRCP